MGAEFATPFDGDAWPVDSLEQIPNDGFLTSAAVFERDVCLSINYRDLRPGDVFLFSSGTDKPTVTDRIISAYQTAACGEKNAKWQHVAILDSRLNVWDAMPTRHVRSRPLREILVERSEVSVVRPQTTIVPSTLDATLLKLSRGRYSFFAVQTGGLLAYRLGRFAKSAESERSFKRAESRVVCSSFVSNVLRRSSGYSFFRELPVVVPADFKANSMFKDVQLYWCRIDIRG